MVNKPTWQNYRSMLCTKYLLYTFDTRRENENASIRCKIRGDLKVLQLTVYVNLLLWCHPFVIFKLLPLRNIDFCNVFTQYLQKNAWRGSCRREAKNVRYIPAQTTSENPCKWISEMNETSTCRSKTAPAQLITTRSVHVRLQSQWFVQFLIEGESEVINFTICPPIP